MKKYLYLAGLLIAYNCYAMELEKLSSEDDKALRFAKLFHKYPKGYGKDKEKEADKMEVLLRQKTSFSLCVVKYWKNIEEKKVFDDMLPEIKQKIYFLAFYDDAKEYYAVYNALNFIDIISQPLVVDSNYEDIWHTTKIKMHKFDEYLFGGLSKHKKCFLSEINHNDSCRIEFSNKGESDQDYPYDDSQVAAYIFYSDAGEKDKEFCTFSRKTIRDMVTFLDIKQQRIAEFENQLKINCESLSKEKENSYNKFIDILLRLREEGSKVIDKKNFKAGNDVNFKIGCNAECLLLSLKEIFSIKNVKYDSMFYYKLLQSKDPGAHKVEFGQEELESWQQFPEDKRNSLENIDIKLKNTPRAFMEHFIMNGVLLISCATPDLIAYSTVPIASAIGCGTTTTTIISIVASLALNAQIGKRFFPHLYAKFNSHTSLVNKCIQQEKIRKTKSHGLLLSMANALHIICSFVGNKCLSCVSLPAKAIGAIMHGIRIPLYYYTHSFMCMDDSRNDIYKASELKVKEIK